MAYTPTGDRNFLACLRRVMEKAWWGIDNGAARAPLALNNESILALDAAGTGTVELIKANASNITDFSNANGHVFTTPVALVAPLAESAAVQSSASATGITLTPAMMLNKIFDRTAAGAAQTDTTPTAAALVAAVPGARVNTAIEWNYRNRSANSVTLGAGVGVTLAAGNTNTISTVSTRRFMIVFTNVSAGTEAVTIYSLTHSAH